MKRILAILLALSMTLALGASLAQSDKTTLYFANYALLETNYTAYWEGVKTGFEAANPEYQIEWITAPYADIMTTAVTRIGAGEPVDLLFGELDWVPTAQDYGMSIPATQIFDEEYLKGFYPAVLDAFKVDGDIYGLPMYITPYILYYNTDIFGAAGIEAVPTTYDEMLAASAKIDGMTTADGNRIFPFGQTTASVVISGSSLQAMIANFGGEVLSQDGQLSIDNEGFTQAITMLKTLDDAGYLPQNAKLKDLRNLFALGQLAMYYDQSWGFSGVKGINPDAVKFTASAPPLKGGQGDGKSALQAASLIYTTKDEAKYEGIRKLTSYLLSEDVLAPYLVNTTPAYPATFAMSNVKAIAESPILAGAASAVGNVMAIPPIPQLADLNLELTALAQAVTIGDEPVDTAIANFKTVAEGLLN